MSTHDDDLTPDESAAPPEDKPWVSELRHKASQADTLAKENEKLARDNALLRAGLGDLNERQLTALIAAHGEEAMTADALSATAVELGLRNVGIPAEEREALGRAAAATAGARAAEAYPMSVNDELARAGSREEVMAILAREGALAEPY